MGTVESFEALSAKCAETLDGYTVVGFT